jgi:hypothetical protein
MKTIVGILLAGLLLPAVAVAQEWTVYTYPDPGFSIQFPGVPSVEASAIKNATGVSLPMTRYMVRQDRIIYTLSVVNYSSTNADALSTIIETERSLSASGKVTAVTGARVNRSFGRRMNIEGTDGSRSTVAIFFVNKHLYTLIGRALPPNAVEESDDAIRFQGSLQFLQDDGGFFGLFGGGNSANTASTANTANTAHPATAAAVAGVTRSKSGSHPPADAACTGKAAGDAVELETPGGMVPATCTLVARPDTPPSRDSPAPAH